jgi:WD40 repeat protein
VTKDGSNARKRAAREYAATHDLPYSEALRHTSGPPRARVTSPVPIRTGDTVLIGHTSAVRSVAFHPDGRSFASAGDVTVRLWDLATQQTTSVLNTDDAVISMAWSRDGATIAVGCQDGTVTFWTIATGQVMTRTAYTGFVWSVAFSPDSRTVATSGFDRLDQPGNPLASVRLWDVATGQHVVVSTRPAGVNREHGHVGYGYAVAFDPTGTTLAASGDGAGSLHLWDLATLSLTELPGHDTTSILAVAFSPDGRMLATGGMDSTIRLWDVATWQSAVTVTPQANQVAAVGFSLDSHILTGAGADPTLRLWDSSTGEPVAVLFGHDRPVGAHAFSPNGRVLVTGSDDRTVRLWTLD